MNTTDIIDFFQKIFDNNLTLQQVSYLSSILENNPEIKKVIFNNQAEIRDLLMKIILYQNKNFENVINIFINSISSKIYTVNNVLLEINSLKAEPETEPEPEPEPDPHEVPEPETELEDCMALSSKVYNFYTNGNKTIMECIKEIIGSRTYYANFDEKKSDCNIKTEKINDEKIKSPRTINMYIKTIADELKSTKTNYNYWDFIGFNLVNDNEKWYYRKNNDLYEINFVSDEITLVEKIEEEKNTLYSIGTFFSKWTDTDYTLNKIDTYQKFELFHKILWYSICLDRINELYLKKYLKYKRKYLSLLNNQSNK